MKQSRVLNETEYKLVLSVCSTSRYPERDTCLVVLSYKLGLRVKELSSILISDVIDDKGSLVEGFYLNPDQTKGDDGRMVYLTNKQVRTSLQSYLVWCETSNITGSRLFWSQKGGHFSPESLSNWFSHLYKRCGLKGCSSHSGRRTFATSLIQKGYDIKSISVLMGHSNIQTTSRYINTNPVMLGDMVKGL